jgi:methane monooxygenase PmoA-like
MIFRVALICVVALGLAAFCSNADAADVTAEKSDAGVVIKIDGQLFTEYVTNFNGTPILWPINGPTGEPMTRAHPMAEGSEAERKDHVHHRSLWFTHGDVNGLSFWHVETIKHREFVKIESGSKARVVTINDWIDGDGKTVCEDLRCLTFGVNGEARFIDYDVTLKATTGPVKIGDTKEGTMAIRVAGTMKVDADKKLNPKWGGKIVNSDGLTDRGAWGKRAAWVDYHGPVNDKVVGVAIMNHPSSFRFPTYWHVRTYGLFAANPFGVHNFEESDKVDGSYTMAKGESIDLRYRFLFHIGDEKEGKVGAAFEAYSKEQK